MRSFFLKLIGLILATSVVSCADGGFEDESEIGVAQQSVISSTNADALIAAGRAQLGIYGGACKEWVRAVTSSSYKVTIPGTAAASYKWTSDTTPATNVARWLSSYANGRLNSTTIVAGATATPLTVWIPNNDSQVVVLYASTKSVTATLTYGSTSVSVTSPTTLSAKGIVSSAVSFPGSMNATLTVKNNGTATATGVIAVVLSKSRFTSDWQTARRGDIIQMYGAAGAKTPHTTFVQTNSNANSTCTTLDTTGCNWLDSNWSEPPDGVVRAHNITMDQMMRWMAFNINFGFTVYRLN